MFHRARVIPAPGFSIGCASAHRFDRGGMKSRCGQPHPMKSLARPRAMWLRIVITRTLSSSSRRKPGSRFQSIEGWIPACAGTT
jgi:hypothetical protein